MLMRWPHAGASTTFTQPSDRDALTASLLAGVTAVLHRTCFLPCFLPARLACT